MAGALTLGQIRNGATQESAAFTGEIVQPMEVLRNGSFVQIQQCTIRHAGQGVPDERVLVHCLLNSATSLVGDNIGTHTTYLRTLQCNQPTLRTSGQVADLAASVDLEGGHGIVEQRLRSSAAFRSAMETLQGLLPDMSAPFTAPRIRSALVEAGRMAAFRSAAVVHGTILHATLTRLGEELYQLKPEFMSAQGLVAFESWRDQFYPASDDSLSGYQLNRMLHHLAHHLSGTAG